MTLIISEDRKMKGKLENALKWAEIIFKDCGIQHGNITSIKVNTRAKTRWGFCKKEGRGYVIEIASILLAEGVKKSALMDTLLHEMLHTCSGCMNHGTLWKRYANIINTKYGYHIKRVTSSAEKGMEPQTISQAKYKIECLGCGTVNYYLRRSRAVQLIEAKPIGGSCYCNRCKSHNFKVEML